MTLAEVRWLSPEEQQAWRVYLLATRLLFAQFDRDMLQGPGIPLTYLETLIVLSEAPDRSLRMSDLADILQSSPSRTSHAVSRMEEMGWIRREPCPSDRRCWYAILTDQGLCALESAAPRHVSSVREHLFDLLTPVQVDQLRDISQTLLRHLSPDGVQIDCAAVLSTPELLDFVAGSRPSLDP